MKKHKKSKGFDKIMAEAVVGNFSFFAWQSISGIMEKCELKIKAYRKDYNEIELQLTPGQEEKLEKVISGSRMLNIYVPELSISFSSELKSVMSDNKIKICPPKEYELFERRKHERVQSTKACFVSIEHNKTMLKKSVYDVSIGGLAIVLSKSDKVVMTKGKIFNACLLEIAGRKIKAKLECVGSVSIDCFEYENLPYGGHKLGFRFIEMSLEDKNFLVEFVTTEILLQQIEKVAK